MKICWEKIKKTLYIMPKKKYFAVLTILLVWFSLQAIKYCDVPIFENAPKYFLKPDGADMSIYNLSMSYIVSYMFYIFVNFIPEWFDVIEKEKEEIPIRCCVHREVQLFTSRLISLWTNIVQVSLRNNMINISDRTDIREVFNRQIIQQSSNNINLSQNSNTISYNSSYLDWYTNIINEINRMIAEGNLIINRYRYDMPSKIFYELFYLINDSNMLGILPVTLNAMISFNSRNILLSQCIDFSGTGGDMIDKSCLAVINLYKWVNTEYSYLMANKGEQDIDIHNINFSI